MSVRYVALALSVLSMLLSLVALVIALARW